jgi:hypothetical protein
MPERGNFEVEEERRAPSGGGSQPVEKWQIAAAGGGIGLILIIVIVVVAQMGGTTTVVTTPAAGGNDGDDVIIDDTPVQAKKIIWAYHDGDLTPFQQLCKETIEKHKGGFDFKLVNKDDVTQHIEKDDLPTGWEALRPQNKRDAAINALLARNGGVAMDLNSIMFRSLDEMWKEYIEEKGVAFKGFDYKSRAETATWFMMVGTKGTSIMQTALARQKVVRRRADRLHGEGQGAWDLLWEQRGQLWAVRLPVGVLQLL